MTHVWSTAFSAACLFRLKAGLRTRYSEHGTAKVTAEFYPSRVSYPRFFIPSFVIQVWHGPTLEGAKTRC
jgi:hypothetical protein